MKSPWPSKARLRWRLDGQGKVQVRSKDKVLGEGGAAGRRERWSVSRGRGESGGESGPLSQLSPWPFVFFPPKPTPRKETYTPRKNRGCSTNTASHHLPSIHFSLVTSTWLKMMDLLSVGCRRGLSQDLRKELLRFD